MRKLLKCFFMSCIVISLLFSLGLGAFAAPVSKTINAVYNNVKIYVDGNLIQPKDGKGNKIEPFVYNGTTYLPVGAIAQALGEPVKWNKYNNSIYIGDNPEAVELTFSEDDDVNAIDPVWNEIIDSFSRKYPNVTIKRTHIEEYEHGNNWNESVASGKAADIMSCNHDFLGKILKANAAKELDSLFSQNFFSQFDKKLLDELRYKGKTYAIPYQYYNALTLIYNKKLVKTPPKTMDELIKLSENLRAQNKYGLVFNYVEPYFFIPFLKGFGGQIFDDTGNITLNTEAMTKTAQFMYDLKYKHNILSYEPGYDAANSLFKEGKAAFIINGPWAYHEYDICNIDFGVTKIPLLSKGNWPGPFVTAKVLLANPNLNDGKKLTAAKNFMEYINTPEVQIKLAKAKLETNIYTVPTNKHALNDDYVQNNPRLKALSDQVSSCILMPYYEEMRSIWDAIRRIFDEVMSGNLDPSAAPARMQEMAEKFILEQSDNLTTTNEKTPEIDIESRPIKLTLSADKDYSDPNGELWYDILKSFMDKYPEIGVKKVSTDSETQKVNWQTEVSAGEGADIIACTQENINLFASANTAMELDSSFSQEFFSKFNKKALDSLKYKDKLYGIPYQVTNSLVLIYNKKLIKDAPKNMDELISVAKKFTNNSGAYGLVFSQIEPYFYLPFLGGFGGQTVDPKGNITLNTEEMKKTIQFLYDLKYKHKIIPPDANYDVANSLFKDGKAAFIINGPWAFDEYKDAGIDFGIAMIPQMSEGSWPSSYLSTRALMVNPNIKDTTKMEAIKKFIEYVNSVETQLKLASLKGTYPIPTNKDAISNSVIQQDPILKPLSDQVAVGTYLTFDTLMRIIFDSTREIVTEVMQDKLKPEEAPAKMQQKADELLKFYGT
ncbi:MAG: extracellular solute-binding protein [Clostridia bacterium]|nr:extracellular solute-binding protein [Clostridia bacterium]